MTLAALFGLFIVLLSVPVMDMAHDRAKREKHRTAALLAALAVVMVTVGLLAFAPISI